MGETLPPEADATPAEASSPAAVRVLVVAGFVDAFGDRWHWTPGAVVRNPYVVGLLAHHGVAVESLE